MSMEDYQNSDLELKYVSLQCDGYENIQLRSDGKVFSHGEEVKSPKISIHIYDDNKCVVQEHIPNNEPDIIWEPLMLDISLSNDENEFKTYYVENTMIEFDDYWIDQNGNKWSVHIYSREYALKLSKSLSCCVDCVNCTSCSFCIGCENCVNCSQCVDCRGCENCTHCDSCSNCYNLSNDQHRKEYKNCF
jgi:hypothetical protein